MCYRMAEKLVLDLVNAKKRLRQYLEMHLITTPPTLSSSTWTLYTDGFTDTLGSGIEMVLQTPTGLKIEKARRLGYKVTNNKVEYEALLQGLELAIQFGIESVMIKTDSQLTVGQVKGDFKMKELRLHMYFSKKMGAKARFHKFDIEQVPREMNQRADELAKSVSAGETIKYTELMLENEYTRDPKQNSAYHVFMTKPKVEYWMTPLTQYLIVGKLLEDPIKMKLIRMKVAQYMMVKENCTEYRQ
ncbi:Ribonuclease H [Parasponia andersonii]|uniref:Ribonuclease H n=1 Tax=Parasponia andersonii TaxID=3476 RepID=A0A2P5A6F2_PARAD|nr:Ribonuclease H [Parasponia andersonii]